MRIHTLNSAFGILSALLVWASVSGGDPNGALAVKKLQAPTANGFTLEVEVELLTSLLPGQGRSTRRLRITGGEGINAIVWQTEVYPTPKYYALGTEGYRAGDYDGEGNLILWMPSEGATVQDLTAHEDYSVDTAFRVAPNGEVVSRTPGGALLRRYPVSYMNAPGVAMLRAVWCALGRLSNPPEGTVAEAPREDGLLAVRGHGKYSPHSGVGEWDLVLDSKSGDLLRRASFGVSGEEPKVRCTTEGIRWFGEIALAERGRFIQGPQDVSVRMISFEPSFSPIVLGDARTMIAKTKSQRVDLFDYRQNPDHPTIKAIQAGELD